MVGYRQGNILRDIINMHMKKITHIVSAAVIYLTIVACASAIADIDETVHWPVEATSNFNSIYGTVSGIAVEEGDSIGMFDTSGNCYGAGVITNGVYHLSAFMEEEADAAIPGDFLLPGFKEGDEVVFKIYKNGTGQEYILVPSSGGPYLYQFEGRHPPITVNLAYNSSDSTPPPGPGTTPPGDTPGTGPSGNSTTSGAVSSGGIPGLLDKASAEKTETGSASDKVAVKARKSDEFTPQQEGQRMGYGYTAPQEARDGTDEAGLIQSGESPKETIESAETGEFPSTVTPLRTKAEKEVIKKEPVKKPGNRMLLPFLLLLIAAAITAVIAWYINKKLS